jgi:hypothetical protein
LTTQTGKNKENNHPETTDHHVIAGLRKLHAPGFKSSIKIRK